MKCLIAQTPKSQLGVILTTGRNREKSFRVIKSIRRNTVRQTDPELREKLGKLQNSIKNIS